MDRMITFLSRLLPSRCELCGQSSADTDSLCTNCRMDLPVIHVGCDICARPLAESGRCGTCLQSTQVINQYITAYLYRYPVDLLIKKYKYNQRLAIVSPLTRELAQKILDRGDADLPEVMVPIPLHYTRQYRRGFNQSLEICRLLKKLTGVPVDHRLVERNRETMPMYRLPPSSRRRNIRGAYRLKKPCPYRSVAVVDDITTTGATANELARLLLSAGTEYVELWALARAED